MRSGDRPLSRKKIIVQYNKKNNEKLTKKERLEIECNFLPHGGFYCA